MTGDEIRNARATLGRQWGKGRVLSCTELARALRLTGNNAATSVLQWERGQHRISGPVSALVELYLAGVLPPDGIPIADSSRD